MHSRVTGRPILAFPHGVVFTLVFILGHQIAVAVLPASELRTVVDDVSTVVECGLITVALLYASRRTASLSRRLSMAWLAWSLALACFALGNVVWCVIELGMRARPFPSLADVFFLAYYPFVLTGLLLLPAAHFGPGERAKVVLDMGIVMLSAVLVFWNFLFGPIISAGAPSAWALALSLAYLAGDLALLWGTCVLLLRPFSAKDPGLLALIAGVILAQILGDIPFGYQSLANTYQAGSLTNVFYSISLALGLLGAARQVALVRRESGVPAAVQEGPPQGKLVTLRMVLTYAWLGAAFLLLVWRYDHPMPMSFPAMALTVAGVIALVLIRQIVALNENAGLAARLQTELSERIRATEALRPLEKALATMNLGVTITDPNGTIVYANPAEEEMHGYARGELVGKPARILAPPNLWQPLTPTERANLRSWQRESINVRKDGSRFSVQLLSDVVKNDAGQLIGVVTSCLDITERKQAEEALRDSEARLRRIANNMCDVITEIDIEGTIRYASPSHYWVLGYHTEPLIGQSVLDRLHPDDVDETVAALFKTLAEHTAPESVTFRYQHADGHYLWMECVGNLIMDADGQVTGIVLSSRDVTGRKEAQEALRKLNEELEERIQQRTAQLARANQELQRTAERQTLLYQVLRVISSQLNPDAIARLAMDAIVELTGWYSVSMAVPNEAGTDWVIQAAGGELAGLGGVTRPMSQGVIGRAFRTGQIQLVQDVRIDPDYARESLVLLSELAMPIRHGERVLAVLNLESDRRAAFGAEEVQLAQSLAEAVALALENARLFEAAQLELAERRRVELVLQGTRARLQHLLSDSPTVIYSAEAHGDFAATYVSDNVQALLGYAAVDFLNDEKFWINHIHPEDVERILGGLGPLFQAGYHTHEYRFQHQDDSYRWMHDELRLIRDDQGQPIEIVGSWMDITDRKLAEEQIQTSLREKEVLLKEIHHRVKNNMQVVSSLLNLQADRLQAPASLEVLRESQNRIKSMALIHEKLYQSKDMARVDFADYVRDLTTHLFRAYRTNAKAVTLQVNVSQDVRLGIDTAIPCGLIVNELVSNALKYAFPDGCAGEVRVELARNGGEGFALTVSDNGVGFPPDMDPRKTNSLGLKLVATLTDQLEGSVELDRSAGTLYRITFSEASA